jgi:phosphatidate cytidylyltransferase
VADLHKRLLVAAIGVPLCVGVVYVGGWFFALGLGLLASIALWEYAHMFANADRIVFLHVGAGAAALYPLVVLFFGFAGGATYAGLLVVAIAVYSIRRLPPTEGPISAAALTLFGIFYTGALLSFAMLLREAIRGPRGHLPETLFFFYPILITWGVDTGAYFVGRSLGKRRMAPLISPNKTVAGGVGGLIAGPVAGLLGLWILPLNGYRSVTVGFTLLFGLLIAIASILGDLVESAMKRECEVKDASNLLPGHGGVLDRLDSLLFAIPAAYIFFTVTLFLR